MTGPSARTNDEPSKNEREAKRLFSTTRTQDALSKWMQIRFKDALKEVDGRRSDLLFLPSRTLPAFQCPHSCNC